MYYFGCVGRPGHYLHDVKLRQIDRTPPWFPIARFETLDGGFLPHGVDLGGTEGVLHIWRTTGWAIIAFLDRSVDKRSGCNSAFVVEAYKDLSDVDAVLAACRAFPSVVSRFKFPLTLNEVQVWPVVADSDVLLTCPFCGGKASSSVRRVPSRDECNSWVQARADGLVTCYGCGVTVSCSIDCGVGVTDENAASAEKAARDKWNARAVE